MVDNRGLQPGDPDFYKHIHPMEDLLAFLSNTSANDDPEDQTLGEEFVFEVYSRRWGKTDRYSFTRTNTGWTISHMQSHNTGKDGRVSGREQTGLYSLLDQDSINYPEELPGYLAYLWEQAAERGLTKDEVQAELTSLAVWTSQLEKSSPKSLLKGYK